MVSFLQTVSRAFQVTEKISVKFPAAWLFNPEFRYYLLCWFQPARDDDDDVANAEEAFDEMLRREHELNEAAERRTDTPAASQHRLNGSQSAQRSPVCWY